MIFNVYNISFSIEYRQCLTSSDRPTVIQQITFNIRLSVSIIDGSVIFGGEVSQIKYENFHILQKLQQMATWIKITLIHKLCNYCLREKPTNVILYYRWYP